MITLKRRQTIIDQLFLCNTSLDDSTMIIENCIGSEEKMVKRRKSDILAKTTREIYF